MVGLEKVYVDFMIWQKLRLFMLLIWNLFIGLFIHPVGGGIVILARCEFHFIKEHENLL